MYYLFAILAVVIVLFIYTCGKRERSMSEATEVILDTLRKNSCVMSTPDIHYAITQAEIDVSVNDVYHQLILLCESKQIRCYKEPEYNENKIVSHGTYAIDTITGQNL